MSEMLQLIALIMGKEGLSENKQKPNWLITKTSLPVHAHIGNVKQPAKIPQLHLVYIRRLAFNKEALARYLLGGFNLGPPMSD